MEATESAQAPDSYTINTNTLIKFADYKADNSKASENSKTDDLDDSKADDSRKQF